MEKMLRAFVEKNLYRDGFRDYLINSFSPVLKEYYLKYDIITYNKLLKKEEQQQLLHKFMEKECSDLFEFCSKNNVSIVGLKGIFIEKQFWSQPRFYNDIDVIIKKDDIKKQESFSFWHTERNIPVFCYSTWSRVKKCGRCSRIETERREDE